MEKHGSAKQNEVQEALFKANFTDGIFLDVANLTSIGASCGLDGKEVERFLTDEGSLKKVREAVHQNYDVVNGGVPFFIINGKPAFSGAQDPSTFHRAFDTVL